MVGVGKLILSFYINIILFVPGWFEDFQFGLIFFQPLFMFCTARSCINYSNLLRIYVEFWKLYILISKRPWEWECPLFNSADVPDIRKWQFNAFNLSRSVVHLCGTFCSLFVNCRSWKVVDLTRSWVILISIWHSLQEQVVLCIDMCLMAITIKTDRTTQHWK